MSLLLLLPEDISAWILSNLLEPEQIAFLDSAFVVNNNVHYSRKRFLTLLSHKAVSIPNITRSDHNDRFYSLFMEWVERRCLKLRALEVFFDDLLVSNTALEIDNQKRLKWDVDTSEVSTLSIFAFGEDEERSIVGFVSNMTKLTSLTYYTENGTIDDLLLMQLNGTVLNKLQHLSINIWDCPDPSSQLLGHIASSCRQLKSFVFAHFSDSENVEQSLIQLIGNNPKLTELKCDKMYLSDCTLTALSLYTPNLRVLDLGDDCCLEFSLPAIATLLHRCALLEQVTLYSASGISFTYTKTTMTCSLAYFLVSDYQSFFDTAIGCFQEIAFQSLGGKIPVPAVESLTRNNPQLHTLRFVGCWSVNLLEVMSCCKSVKTLVVVENEIYQPQIRAADLVAICLTHPSLNYLDLSQYTEIESADIKTLLSGGRIKTIKLSEYRRAELNEIQEFVTEKNIDVRILLSAENFRRLPMYV